MTSWFYRSLTSTHTDSNTKATRRWRVVYPSSCLLLSLLPQAVILVSAEIDTNQWLQLSIPDTRDLVTIQFTGSSGRINISNIYNDCHNSEAIDQIGACASSFQQEGLHTDQEYAM